MRLHCRILLTEFELDIDASFDARVTSIFGPSGSGKTTLLDAIAGLRPVAAGEIEIGGKVLFSSARGICCTPQQRNIGYVPQEAALFPHLSVRQNIAFGARRNPERQPSAAPMLEHVIDVLEIGTLLNRSVAQLSGGENQRVALARAIASAPRVLLLDEPLAALDIGLKEKILPYLGRVRDEFKVPIIYVTHNMTEVLTLADWVLLIRRGRLVAQGLPQELFHSTTAMTTMDENHLENVFHVHLVESNDAGGISRVRTEKGLELLIPCIGAASGTFQIGLSADEIVVGTQRPEALSAANIIQGKTTRIEIIPGQAVITVDAGEIFYVRLTPAAVERLRLRTDATIYLIVKARSFRLL